MLKDLHLYLFPKDKQDIRAFRIIILAAFINFIIFSLLPHEIKENDAHVLQLINFMEAVVFFFIFLSTFFIKNTYKNINFLSFVAAYIINIVNLGLTYLSYFEDRLAYQYLVYYLIISIYFITYRAFLFFQLVNILLFILLLIIGNHSNCSDYSDYYITALTSFVLIFVISAINNSRRKENEELDAKYKLLAENSSDVVSIQNLTGEVLYVSPSIKELTGYSQEDLIGKNVIKIINPISYDEVKRYNDDLKNKTIENNSYLFNIINANGTNDWYEFNIKLSNANQVLLNSRKVTKRVEFQNMLNDKTNEVVAKNQDLMTFSFIASHDMKEPLRMIIIYQKMLLNKLQENNDSVRDYITTSLKAAENMYDLVSNLFSYTKLHDYELRFEQVNLSQLVNNIKNKLELFLIENNSEIILYNDTELYGDKQMLELLIQNIILNGLKYNKSDRPTVHIQSRISPLYIHIDISDNGIGIEEAYRSKIFEAFARLHNKNEYSGTGLGLTIANKIIEKHKGIINIQSEINKGSTFTISIKKT